MQRHRIPLNPLRAFEVASRRMSFAEAAKELSVTSSTISKHIANLERTVGTNLFVRRTRSIELTSAGRRLQASTSRALDELARSLDEVIEQVRVEGAAARPFRLRVLTAIALKLIVPEMQKIESIVENVDLDLSIKSSPRELEIGEYDLAVSYSRDMPSNPDDVLFREQAIPVCSPRLLHEGYPVRNLPPSDVVHARLIGATEDLWDWKSWAVWARVNWPTTPNIISVETDEMAIQAATSGGGIALAELRLISSELASGLLVPACSTVPMEVGYYYVENRSYRAPEITSAVVTWLHEISATALAQSLQSIGRGKGLSLVNG